MLTREEIISRLADGLEPLEYVNAAWLEGADASGLLDEFSDIDFYVDFEDDYEAECIAAVETLLAQIAPIDYRYVMGHAHPKLRQRIYHLAGSSPYCMIDFCWQLRSRDPKEWTFVEGNRVEAAKVLFDKRGLVRTKPYNPEDYVERNRALQDDAKYCYAQHVRVRKYILRGEYPEAYIYYNRYVIEPLVTLLRLIYTPANADYYMIHISHHIPKADVERLNSFLRISSLSEMDEKISPAEVWFDELLGILNTVQ